MYKMIIKAFYSKRLEKAVINCTVASMADVLENMNKAKSAKSILYAICWPNGEKTMMRGYSERNARQTCRMLSEYFASQAGLPQSATHDYYMNRANDFANNAQSDNPLTLALAMQVADIWFN